MKNNSFCNCNKKNKIPKNEFHNGSEDLYTENYKALLKEIGRDNEMKRYSMVMDWKSQHS